MRAKSLVTISQSQLSQASGITFGPHWEGLAEPARSRCCWDLPDRSFAAVTTTSFRRRTAIRLEALSDDYLENDLVAIQRPDPPPSATTRRGRLCAVKPDGSVVPLCRRSGDVETDLYADPREFAVRYWNDPQDEHALKTYGEGYYGQRPIPSLGGGPGYGAEADEVWSVDERILKEVELDGVELPILDVGIAHGEKARGGSF